MACERVKLICKKPGCQRVSCEIYLNEASVPIVKIKNNRHNGKVHEPEFSLQEILGEIENMKKKAC